jgi:hypothetical protein
MGTQHEYLSEYNNISQQQEHISEPQKHDRKTHFNLLSFKVKCDDNGWVAVGEQQPM